MREKLFIKDIKAGDWMECAAVDAPVCSMVIVHRQEETGMAMSPVVWCEAHKTYEYIENFLDREVITETGCRKSGFPLELLQWGDDVSPKSAKQIDLCWRVRKNSKDGISIIRETVDIALLSQRDAARDRLVGVPKARPGKSQCFTIQLSSPKNSLERNTLPAMPSIVADAAIEMLADDAERDFGLRPTLPSYAYNGCFADGRTRLTAFLDYPFHVALWLYAQDYLKGGNHKKTLPGPDEDTFSYLAEALCLASSAKIRAYFEKNPCCLGTLAILHVLGINDESLCEPFLGDWSFFGTSPVSILKNMGASPFRPLAKGEYTARVFSDKEALRTLLPTGRNIYQEWDSLVFYCRWQLHRQGEQLLAAHLLSMQEKWTPRYMDAVQVFHRFFLELPESLLEQILRDGLTLKLHNKMISHANETSLGGQPFSYDDRANGYECRMGEYSFRLIRDQVDFRAVASKVGNVVCWNKAPLYDDGTLRVVMERHGRPVALIMLHGTARLFCAGTSGCFSEALVAARIRIAYLRWMKWTGLYKRYEPFYAEDYDILSEDVHAEPFEKRPSSLHEMLSMAPSEFRPGDYLRFYQLLKAANLLHFITLPRETFASEKDYLMQVFPYGKPIYLAAMEAQKEDIPYSPPGEADLMDHIFPGWRDAPSEKPPKNREAAYVLSLLYGDGFPPLLPKDEERAAYWRSQSEYGQSLGTK